MKVILDALIYWVLIPIEIKLYQYNMFELDIDFITGNSIYPDSSL